MQCIIRREEVWSQLSHYCRSVRMLVQGILLAAMLGLSQQAGEPEILDKIGTKLEELGKLHQFARPITDQTHPIKVKIGFTLLNIMDFNKETGIIKVNGYSYVEWKDDSVFTWNPEEYSGITHVDVHRKSGLWIPDLFQYNRRRPTMDMKHTRLEVGHDGAIRWIPLVSMEAKCERDDHKSWCKDSHTYHHNLTATCNFHIGSWTYTTDLLKVESSHVHLSGLQPDDVWTVVHASHADKDRKFPCCEHAFSEATFTIKVNGQYDG